jgi:IS605 OrfB family transposase
MTFEKTTRTFTYHTRIPLTSQESEVLDACAEHLSRVERRLFADISAGKDPLQLKSLYIKEFGITTRQYNALRIQLEGKIDSIRELQPVQIIELQDKIAEAKKMIQKLEKKNPDAVLHQKKRRLYNLEQKLQQLEHDKAEGKVSLCFGSKRLFRAQFDLETNGYQNHGEWLVDWQSSRSNSFFLLGSKDESGGNQSCTAFLGEGGLLNLRVRLPDLLEPNHGKYLFLKGIHFKYGHDKIMEAIEACEERKRLLKLKEPNAKEFGVPISYRFKRDEKGWRVFVSIPIMKSNNNTSSNNGVIGLDINANHLAVAEMDRFGNPVTKTIIPLNTYGKSKDQAKALIGDACSSLISLAKSKGKTLVIEQLDFSKKKAELKDQGRAKYARMLSSFSYSQIKNNLQSSGWKNGVEVVEVNPAYTSIIGRVKFANRYGLSVHIAAALVIGRRYLKTSERVPRHLDKIPDGRGNHVTLSLPVRNRDKHVWSSWRMINTRFKTVHAALFRASNRSSRSKSPLEKNTIPKNGGGIPPRESVNSTA